MRTIGNAAGGMSVRVPPINAYQMTRKSCSLRHFPADHVVEPPVIVSSRRPSARSSAKRAFIQSERAATWMEERQSHLCLSLSTFSSRNSRWGEGSIMPTSGTVKSSNPLGRSNMAQRKSGGRKYGKAAGKTVASAMRRKKKGTLNSGPGGKGGTVKSRKQAIAIGLSEARKKGAKVPRKKSA